MTHFSELQEVIHLLSHSLHYSVLKENSRDSMFTTRLVFIQISHDPLQQRAEHTSRTQPQEWRPMGWNTNLLTDKGTFIS